MARASPSFPARDFACSEPACRRRCRSASSDSQQPLQFQIDLSLLGTSDFQFTPVGRETHVMLSSDWPHPSFVGQFLPREREITSAGFSADWRTSFFATNLEEAMIRCPSQADPGAADCADFASRHFGVSFVDPVDQYLKTDRAVKYGFLFILLTFAGFFLLEVLRRFSVHPVQYGLVGLALALFFLLLLSFSEHIGFAAAYVVSATACVGLITYYVTACPGQPAPRSGLRRGTGDALCTAVRHPGVRGLRAADWLRAGIRTARPRDGSHPACELVGSRCGAASLSMRIQSEAPGRNAGA